MPIDPDLLSLPETPRVLREEYGRAPDYNQVWRLVTAGHVPAERRGARLYVQRTDLPRIAELLGLIRPNAA
jgi:hypothetical protein